MLIQTERFEMRLTPEDRQRLDQLAAQANRSRAEVFKSWLRSGDLPDAGDSVARVTVSEADTLAMSDQL